MIALALLLLQTAAQNVPSPPDEPSDEIVVTGRRVWCDFQVDGAPIKSRELDRRAKRWAAGVPVRVIVSDINDFRCLSKITTKLSRKGVRAFAFVGPEGQEPVTPAAPDARLADPGEARRQWDAERSATLNRRGKCVEAAQLLIDAGDPPRRDPAARPLRAALEHDPIRLNRIMLYLSFVFRIFRVVRRFRLT
ncbi:MAG: hypothetical protein WDN24_02965 [Sphingomonas sp.]